MSGSRSPVSAWEPLRIGIFRALWLAVLVSNIGTWMQTVGAQWLVVRQPHAALLVALVQAASTAPVLLVALPAGVLADTFDRRWLLLVLQVVQAITGLALTLLTSAGQMPPALLLTFTFVLGAASIMSAPAYQALIPDIVPCSQVQSASALGSINVNEALCETPPQTGHLIAADTTG